MLKRFSTNFAVLSIFLDAASIIFSLWFITIARPILGRSYLSWIVKEMRVSPLIPLELYIIFPFLWIVIYITHSVYDGSKNLRIVDEFSSLTIGSLQAGVLMAGFLYLTYRDISRALFVFFVIAAYLLMIFWRAIARPLYAYRNSLAQTRQRILVIGAGPVGNQIKEVVQRYQYISASFVGFLDDDLQKASGNPDILGTLDIAHQAVKENNITDVIIALPLRAYQRTNQVVIDLLEAPVRIWIVPDYFQLALHQARIQTLFDIPMLDLRAPALTESQRLLKRIFDLVITSVCLVFALPIMALVALAIVLDDGGPVFFNQLRVGENGRLFTMYKFRTMVKNAEQLRHLVEQTDENGNLIHKHRHDPRVTRVGRILRKLSLDELPQLFNIFRGQMSWVGPRPELPYLVEKYQAWQRKRFAVPQGLTGWWQIHGRSDKPMHLHTEDDLYYVQNYSIWLDIEILVKTAWIVIRGKGAY
jgi:exopolysaccharide biosynthesis polyprenyl glycosylphosphotransferase